MLLKLVTACFLVVFFSTSAGASTILQDAGFADANASFFGPGQSFIADEPSLLTIAFAFSDLNPASPNAPVTITLYEGAGLGGAVLDAVTQTLPAVLPSTIAPPQFIDFDFSGNAITPGAVYTAAVSTTSSKIGVVYNSISDDYANGQIFFANSSIPDAFDLNFRITTVPEPSTALLVGLGLATLAISRARRVG